MSMDNEWLMGMLIESDLVNNSLPKRSHQRLGVSTPLTKLLLDLLEKAASVY